MSTTTTGSLNIAVLDSKIIANLCDGLFYIDITPSIWIGTGYDNVLGASIKITNPYGVIIKNYPTSGYDIYPPFTDDDTFSIPTQANNYQYGTYTIVVRITDADGTNYEISKGVNICQPDAKNKNKNYGSLSAELSGICRDGKVYVTADTPPTYKGVISDSQVNDFTLEYPTSSGLDELETEIGSFSTYLFEGVYKFTGTICANYPIGDNVFIKVNYRVKKEKNIACELDESCIYAKLGQLNEQLNSDCTDAEKVDTQNTIITTLLLLKSIEVSIFNGFDASDFITELEKVLGCVCTCNCNDGTPVINTDPSKDFVITGCGFTKTTVGLTDTYAFDSENLYVLEVVDNGGAIAITTPTIEDCTVKQTLTFKISTVYAQIKNEVDNTNEYNFWASVINNALAGLDGDCIGLTTNELNALTLKQKIQAIIDAQCEGGDCNAAISTNTTDDSANNVVVSWVNVEDVYEVAIYLDGILVGTVLGTEDSFTISGAADNAAHDYTLVAKCSNGSIGNTLEGSFTYYGCPAIATPTLSSNNVSDATCPYDLTALVDTLPMGITAEWHNLNNTSVSSLVPDPTLVTDGVYFCFAKNSDGCYSVAAQVILTCTSTTSCSAPQTLLVEALTSDFLIKFQSAAYPPPLNSYTVKRRLTADPDISGSYTTIGTPTWNATSNRWEILDTTGIDNTLYTYRAISNCTSSAPYIDYIFANLTCPTVTLTPDDNLVDYSFVDVGGSVDKYEVSIYSADGITLVHTDTVVPAFSNPIVGTFIYLDLGTIYKVKVRVFIGTYYKDCPLQSVTTLGFNISGSITNVSHTVQVNISQTLPCNVTFALTGIYDDAGDPTAFSANVTILAGDYYGINNTAVSAPDTITSIDPNYGSYQFSDSQVCSGDTYDYLLDIENPTP